MHDRFETEVQKKMEELALTPSAPVWERIELEIKPEKKRRRVIIWFFCGLLFLSGGFFLYQSSQQKDSIVAKTKTPEMQYEIPKIPAPPQHQEAVVSEKVADNNPLNQPMIEARGRSKPAATRHTIIGMRNSERNLEKSKQTESVFTANTTPLQVEKNNPTIATKTVTAGKPEIKKNDRSTTSVEKNTIEEGNVKNDSTFVAVTSTLTDTAAKKLPAEVEKTTADSSLKKRVAESKRWTKRLSFAVGQTGYTSASLFKSATYDAMAQPPGAGLSGNGAGRAANTNAGIGFSLGLSFVKKLSERLELAAGVQYAYSSTKLNVGDRRRRDTMVVYNSSSLNAANFYTNSGNGAYTNHFHAVEIPVMLSYKPSLKVPIYISIGAAYGRIFSTNALTFSPGSNVYYDNKENYLRNTLPLFSSVQVELFARKKVSLRIGPAFQYNLLKVQKESSSSQAHFFFAGLKGGINF